MLMYQLNQIIMKINSLILIIIFGYISNIFANSLISSSLKPPVKKAKYIAKFINKLVTQWNILDKGIHDVVILNAESEKSRSAGDPYVTAITQKLNMNTILMPDINEQYDFSSIRKGAFVIVLSDVYNYVRLIVNP